MNRHAYLIYGVVSTLASLFAIAALIAFVYGALPASLRQATLPASPAAAINVGLLALFGALCGLAATPDFKRRLARHVPLPLLRSAEVLLSSAALTLLMWQWRPLPAAAWQPDVPVQWLLWGASALGWLLALAQVLASDPLGRVGLRQAFQHWRGIKPAAPQAMAGPQRRALVLGLLLALWCAPPATWGQLLFALGMSGYLLLALAYAERGRLRAARLARAGRDKAEPAEPRGVAFGRNEYPWSGRLSHQREGRHD
jgi:hypothetical protein